MFGLTAGISFFAVAYFLANMRMRRYATEERALITEASDTELVAVVKE